MQKERAQALRKKALEVGLAYSNPDREFNHNKESFTLDKIVPLSETTVAAIYDKSTGKRAMAFFYWINGGGGYWQYFFPSDSHIFGMRKLPDILHKIEQTNFEYNFEAK